jgi:hypothetical protein
MSGLGLNAVDFASRSRIAIGNASAALLIRQRRKTELALFRLTQ